jgi:hypothetical protein
MSRGRSPIQLPPGNVNQIFVTPLPVLPSVFLGHSMAVSVGPDVKDLIIRWLQALFRSGRGRTSPARYRGEPTRQPFVNRLFSSISRSPCFYLNLTRMREEPAKLRHRDGRRRENENVRKTLGFNDPGEERGL